MSKTAGVDRRSLVRERHRRAILDAADALVLERDGPRFSVDELAERADVGRRTIFNHFTSLDDVVISVCTEVLAKVIDDVRVAAEGVPVGDHGRASMFDEVAQTLRAADFPTAITYVTRAFGGSDGASARHQQFANVAFARLAGQLTAEQKHRHPEVDGLECELLVSSLVNGLVVISRYWIERDRGSGDVDPEVVWYSLLDRLIASMRSGYRRSPSISA